MSTEVQRSKLKPRTISAFADYGEAENAELVVGFSGSKRRTASFGSVALLRVFLSRSGIQK